MLAFYLSFLETEEEKNKFIRLYEEYRNLMLNTASRKIKDPYAAEDAVHEAFIKLTRYLHAVDETNCHKTRRFLVLITESVVMDMLRKEMRCPTDSYDEWEAVLSCREDVLDKIAVRELMDLIARLPEIYRTALELRAYHGLNEKQIADIVGISYAAARKRLERARALLAQKLNEREEVGLHE